MTRPFYTSAASQDLTEILNYIARDNPAAALAWVERIEAKCVLIGDNPSIGELQPHLGEGCEPALSVVMWSYTAQPTIESKFCE